MENTLKRELGEVDELVTAEKHDEAMRLLDKLLVSHPDEARIWRSRSYVNSHQGNTQAAISDVSKAIAICELEPDYFYTRGILFFREGSYRHAVSDFTKVIELCDYHESNYYREGAYFFRADAYVRLKEFDKAKADCKHVKNGMSTWTDEMKSKEDILAECEK